MGLSEPVFVSPGCRNRIPERKGLSKETCILTNLQAGKARARVAAIVVSGERPLSALSVDIDLPLSAPCGEPMVLLLRSARSYLTGSVSESQKGLSHMDFGNVQL